MSNASFKPKIYIFLSSLILIFLTSIGSGKDNPFPICLKYVRSELLTTQYYEEESSKFVNKDNFMFGEGAYLGVTEIDNTNYYKYIFNSIYVDSKDKSFEIFIPIENKNKTAIVHKIDKKADITENAYPAFVRYSRFTTGLNEASEKTNPKFIKKLFGINLFQNMYPAIVEFNVSSFGSRISIRTGKISTKHTPSKNNLDATNNHVQICPETSDHYSIYSSKPTNSSGDCNWWEWSSTHTSKIEVLEGILELFIYIPVVFIDIIITPLVLVLMVVLLVLSPISFPAIH